MPWGFCKQPDLGMTRRRKSFCLLRGQRHLVANQGQCHATFFPVATLPTFLRPGKWRAGEVKGQENRTLSALCGLANPRCSHYAHESSRPRAQGPTRSATAWDQVGTQERPQVQGRQAMVAVGHSLTLPTPKPPPWLPLLTFQCPELEAGHQPRSWAWLGHNLVPPASYVSTPGLGPFLCENGERAGSAFPKVLKILSIFLCVYILNIYD